jgi:hypothetical protein
MPSKVRLSCIHLTRVYCQYTMFISIIMVCSFDINLNILNMPKDSQNICDELKSTVVCHVTNILYVKGPSNNQLYQLWLCELHKLNYW